jgi:hypothetical protein
MSSQNNNNNTENSALGKNPGGLGKDLKDFIQQNENSAKE